MESAWQGEAAGAAQRGALPLAIEHEQAAPLLFTDHDLFSRQVGSFDDARHRVMPVPPAPDEPSGFEILFSPGELVTYERKLAEHNAAAQHNVDVMDGYEGASSYNGENLPTSYGSLTPDSAGMTVAPASGGEPGDGGPPDPRSDPGQRPQDEMEWTPHTAPDERPGVGGESPEPPQSTRPDGHVPPPAVPTANAGLPGSGPNPPTGGPSPVGGLVPVGGVPGSDDSAGSNGPGVRGGAGVPGNGGQPRHGDAGHGPGGRTGAGPLAGGAAADAAGRGAAGARGLAGAGLPVGMGAGRGRGAEDIERKAPTYLEEPDPEGLLGTDEVTAPPVIGVDEETGEPAR
jgi:hypothetical protein